MDVILHIGAHRTGTTSFQHFMRQHGDDLTRQGIGFWGPLRTRAGLFSGVLPEKGDDRDAFDTARRRIATEVQRAEDAGLSHLIVSEENIAGQPARNMREARLYPGIGDRVARVARAFDHRIDRVVLSVRPQQAYWPSLLAFAVERGHHLPGPMHLGRIADSPRRWQDVVRDIAGAQGAPVLLPEHGIDADLLVAAMTGGTAQLPAPRGPRLNAAPDRADLRAALATRGAQAARIPAGDGPWQPFDAVQQARLTEAWQDDEFWLAGGAGGLATFLPLGRRRHGMTHRPERAGYHLPPGLLGRGHGHGIEERRLVGSGRERAAG